MTSVTSTRFSAFAASRSICSPSSPRPWKAYGELRGLKAPPRNTFAPARRTAAAAACTCGSLSAEHGPAMTITSSPPIRMSPTETIVPSGLKVLLASLYGSEIRSTSCTPSSSSMSALSGCPCPTAPSTVRVTPVDRCTSMPISTSRATTCSICASLARSSITTTMACVSPFAGVKFCTTVISFHRHARRRALLLVVKIPVDEPPLEAARFVDDALEQPRDRVGTERAFGCDAADVREHLLLAFGLIHLGADLLLEPADLTGHAGAFIQQADQHFIHPVDVVSQIVERRHDYTRPERLTGRSWPFNHRTYCSTRSIRSGLAPASAITDTSELP